MSTLSELNRLQVLIRYPQFMADVRELTAPFDLRRVFPSGTQGRVALLRTRLTQALGHSHISPEGISKLLKQLKSGTRQKGALSHAVKVLPDKTTRGTRGVPGTIRLLRDGRFLKLEIDLTAAHKEDLLKEVGEYISDYQPEQARRQRKDKHHKSTSHIDLWEVYDRWKSGAKPYQIARRLYRERTETTAGFGTNTKEYKAVHRKLKAAKDMIERNPYPHQ